MAHLGVARGHIDPEVVAADGGFAHLDAGALAHHPETCAADAAAADKASAAALEADPDPEAADHRIVDLQKRPARALAAYGDPHRALAGGPGGQHPDMVDLAFGWAQGQIDAEGVGPDAVLEHLQLGPVDEDGGVIGMGVDAALAHDQAAAGDVDRRAVAGIVDVVPDKGDLGIPRLDAAGLPARIGLELEPAQLHLLHALSDQHAGLAVGGRDHDTRAAGLDGEGGRILAGDDHRMVDLDGLAARLAVRADIDHPAVGDIGGGVRDRRAAVGGVGAVDGDAGRTGAVGRGAIGRAIGPAVALVVASAPAVAAAVPDPIVEMVMVERRMQQDAEVWFDLLIQPGGDVAAGIGMGPVGGRARDEGGGDGGE